MPTNLEQQQLTNCRTRLLALYIQGVHEQILLQQLKAVDEYYTESFNKSTYSHKDIADSYELFVNNLIDVKNGNLSAKVIPPFLTEAKSRGLGN